MKTRNAWLTLALVLLLAAGGFGAPAARQTTGIYVTVDRLPHSLFLDFPSREAATPAPFEIQTTLTTDLTTWVDGDEVPPDRHSWVLKVESEGVWTIGPASSRSRKAARRFILDVKKTGVSREYLSAWFSPDSSGEAVRLTIALGDREGLLVFRLTEKKVVEEKAVSVDARSLLEIRDGLLAAAAAVEDARRTRHRWSSLLVNLGDVVLENKGEGWLEELDLMREDDFVTLGIRGQLPGDREAVKELCGRLRAGRLSELFQTVQAPQIGLKKGELRPFSLAAQTVTADWTTVPPLQPTAGSRDVPGLAEEILYLESRLAFYAPKMVGSLKDAQGLILDAKRKADTLISRITPRPISDRNRGLRTFEVSLKVGGAGPAIVEFLRVLEDRTEPLRIVPLTLRQTEFGPELTLSLVFLSYRPLEVTNADLARAVKERGDSPEARTRRDRAVRKLPLIGGKPYVPPQWPRDPFSRPRRED